MALFVQCRKCGGSYMQPDIGPSGHVCLPVVKPGGSVKWVAPPVPWCRDDVGFARCREDV